MSAYTKVPMDRLAPLIDEWIQQEGHSQRLLSQRSGVPERRIYAIRRGFDSTWHHGVQYRYTNVEFSTADRLLLAMDRQLEWYERLKDLYDAAA